MEQTTAAHGSFDGWYRAEHPRLLALLTVVALDTDLAAEATAEAFTRALERWDRVATMSSPSGWTYRVGVNLIRRRLRRAAFERRTRPSTVVIVRAGPGVTRVTARVADGRSVPVTVGADGWGIAAFGRANRRRGGHRRARPCPARDVRRVSPRLPTRPPLLPCSGPHSSAVPPPGRPPVIDESNVAAHADPVWIGRADFLIFADLSTSDLPGRWEQLWAKRLGPDRFQLCCIPFFAYGLVLADEVETGAGPEGDLVIVTVAVASDHAALRVAFLAAAQGEELAGRVIGAAAAAGCLVERYSRRYLAIDVLAGSPELAGLTRLLDPLQDQGLVEYELSR